MYNTNLLTSCLEEKGRLTGQKSDWRTPFNGQQHESSIARDSRSAFPVALEWRPMNKSFYTMHTSPTPAFLTIIQKNQHSYHSNWKPLPAIGAARGRHDLQGFIRF